MAGIFCLFLGCIIGGTFGFALGTFLVFYIIHENPVRMLYALLKSDFISLENIHDAIKKEEAE
jgi:hypothetical protein